MSELQELFDRDPLKLTKEDRSVIIKFFQEQRKAHINAPATKSKTPKKAANLNAPVGEKTKVSLSDILGDIE